MYIPNPDNVKVGYGYRLLGDDEIPIQNSDEVMYIHLGVREGWEKADGFARSVQKTVREYKREFSANTPIYYRRKIEIPEGYRLIGADETVENKNVKFIQHHFNKNTVSINWYDNSLVGVNHIDTPINFWGGKDSIEKNGVAYIQKIENDNVNTCNNMKKENNNPELELEKVKKEQEIAKQKQLAAQNRIIELEKIIKDKKDKEFKVGDYVLCIDTDNIYKVRKMDSHSLWMDDFDDNIWCSKLHYRKATNEEIEKYILVKAAEKGWIVGAKVKHNSPYSKNSIIDSLSVSFDGKCSSLSVYNYFNKIKEPFVVIRYDGCSASPISEMILIKDEPITVVVNGQTYTAEFYKTSVNFGCAKISRRQIVNALEFINKENGIEQESNRKFESIKIGKGEFTIELLTKLNKKFKELDNK